jgi:L-ascorbate metabolism protein UlaG (beta-lactamase superfamily)
VKENPFLGLRRLYGEPETKQIHRQMLQWMESTLDWVEGVLARHPPAWPEPEVRRRALYMLDEPLHVLSAPIEPPIAEFLNRRIETAVIEIENERVKSGVTIWKLYNHGFVIRTPEVTIGFDLHQGPYETFHIRSELFDRILQATEALFISHQHRDHADAYAIARMIEMGRPVVVPPGIRQQADWDQHLIQPERHWKVHNDLVLGATDISYRVFPGHQGIEPLNNVYLVDLPQDLHIMQTGDQSYMEDFYVWIDGLHEQFEVDVLLPNCWSTDLRRLIDGIRPRLVITGHENEMAHPVDHREAFSKTYAHIAEEPTPVLVMAWGERYHYEKDQPLMPAMALASESTLSATGMRAAALEERRKEPQQGQRGAST